MNSSDIFEILNDFLINRQPEQLLALSTPLEVFSSKTLSDGKLYHGSKAPEAFRKAIRKIEKSKTVYHLTPIKKSGNVLSGIYIVDIKKGKDTTTSAIAISVDKSNLISLLEI